jgi:hypothetical protein
MTPITGALINAIAAPAKSHPKALACFLRGKYAPMSVYTMGSAIPKPNPEIAYTKSIRGKLGARKHPTEETPVKKIPKISNDLCLNRTLHVPVNIAEIVVIREAVVVI